MIVFGKHPVMEFIETAPDAVEEVWVDRDERRSIFAGAKLADADTLSRLTGDGNHQGFVIRTAPFKYATVESIIGREVIGVVDQVTDPRNLGAIIRSAAAFDIPVVIPKDRAAAVTESVVRTSAGLVYQTPVVQVVNVARFLGEMREHGYWSIAADAGGEQNISEVAMDPKTILVLGGEAGLRRLTRETCDFVAHIPMAPKVESLNVSVGFAIFAYEFRRRNPINGAST